MKISYTTEELVPSTDFAKGFGGYISKIISGSVEKLAVVKNNKPEAVVISIAEYERIKQLANLAEDLSLAQMVHERVDGNEAALRDYDDYAERRKAKMKRAV
ncbi:type II toxin-antitoxin system prevent-host-death family antitoxin [Sulfurovum sp.]|uniref:type II toxin-antitoxin system prevent-host-death family antitoxin n=1 Tax=Sulfurovum sp. TaxID=1969726 RepID=UPI003563010E